MSTVSTPRKPRKSPKCECGCGQAPYKTARNRKAQCVDCGYVLRMTREWIEHGLPTCPCGGEFELPCLFDRASLPGIAGAEAWARVETERVTHEILSERSSKAIRSRRRCKHDGCGRLLGRGELYCARHAHADLPF